MDTHITEILRDYLSRHRCPGVLAAVSNDGPARIFSAGSIREEDHHRCFYVYSISKTFTAAAILKLCEVHGDFLDDPLHRFLPDAPVPSGITIRHLLNHSGGVSDYFSSREYHEAVAAHPGEPWDTDKLMETGLASTPLFPPGKGWAYSNPGYGFLKAVIEELTGKDYHAHVGEAILTPTGLHDTRPFLAPDLDLELLEGEAPEFQGDFRQLYHPGWILPGCFISTVADVVRFYQALFRGDLITEKSLREMKRTVDVLDSPTSSPVPAYGLGLMHFRDDPLGEAYGHGGGGPGYTTYARHYPDLDGRPFTLALVLNKSLPRTPFDLADEIVRICLR